MHAVLRAALPPSGEAPTAAQGQDGQSLPVWNSGDERHGRAVPELMLTVAWDSDAPPSAAVMSARGAAMQRRQEMLTCCIRTEPELPAAVLDSLQAFAGAHTALVFLTEVLNGQLWPTLLLACAAAIFTILTRVLFDNF